METPPVRGEKEIAARSVIPPSLAAGNGGGTAVARPPVPGTIPHPTTAWNDPRTADSIHSGSLRMKMALLFLVFSFVLTVAHMGLQVWIPATVSPFWRQLAFISIAIGVGLFAAAVISAYLTRPLRQLAAASEVISHGDLTRRVPEHRRDEIGALGVAFNRMVGSLVQVVSEARRVAGDVSGSATALSRTTGEMNENTTGLTKTVAVIARGAENQAAMVERMVDIMRRLAESIGGISDRAREATSTAEEARKTAEQGEHHAGRAAERISWLADRIGEARSTVQGFERLAARIHHTVAGIQAIAQQTHLLALNATIEAARAGENGRGFAVVAEEVRKLSDEARRQATEISALAETITGGVTEVLDAMQSSTAAATEGRQVVGLAADALRDIVAAVRSAATGIEAINGLTETQREASSGLVSTADEIARIARTNASGTREASTATDEQMRTMQQITGAARDLARSSESLRDLIARFRLE